jgi:exodeoxyribonuclease VII large subunit
MPVPVWTGIGHETDNSVLDAVAAQSFRTPTAVAEALVVRFSVTYDASGVLLRSIHGLARGQTIETHLADGRFEAS